MRLRNKVALVTGGSRGIGESIVLNLAAEGAEVIFTYNSQKVAAESVLKEVEKVGRRALYHHMNVTDQESVKSIIAKIDDTYGKLDILVNNAGINKPTDFDKITVEDWDEILSVNLKGPFICAQESFYLLKKSENASIINIGSVSGQYGGPRTAHYAASKAGLISLGQVIARFGAKDNIRCNTIAAGLIASEMAENGLKSSAVASVNEGILIKRLGTQKEVADAVVFLASDESSYITAQTINVNGGLYF